jgi:hypothetical protein
MMSAKIQEVAMKQECTRRELTIAAAVAAAVAMAGSSALAQDATTTSTTTTSPTTSSAGVLTTSATKPAGSATSQMIQEACQRSQARTDNLRKLGRPEQWGSEEPFTFDPNKVC